MKMLFFGRANRWFGYRLRWGIHCKINSKFKITLFIIFTNFSNLINQTEVQLKCDGHIRYNKSIKIFIRYKFYKHLTNLLNERTKNKVKTKIFPARDFCTWVKLISLFWLQ
jgi:hypothetical protein